MRAILRCYQTVLSSEEAEKQRAKISMGARNTSVRTLAEFRRHILRKRIQKGLVWRCRN